MAKLSLPKAVTSLFERLPFVKPAARSGSHMRAHQRHACVLVSELLIAEKGFKLDGMVIEVSRGGIRFREASNYILDRRGTPVVVMVGGQEHPGVIVNVGNNGYGIKLDQLMTEEEVDRLMGGSVTTGRGVAEVQGEGEGSSEHQPSEVVAEAPAAKITITGPESPGAV